jgi:predicted acyl esterase
MRDGVKLVDIYLPQADEKFPGLAVRTPYSRERAIALNLAQQRATPGIHRSHPRCPWRRDSEGAFQLFLDDENEGYDTVE